tara:strand:- start:34 stop:948 length:915 start_codon:yes stop_codon:yes gene_type:complete
MNPDDLEQASVPEISSRLGQRLRLVEDKMRNYCVTQHAIANYSRVEEALDYHLSQGGKKIRAQIALDAAKTQELSIEIGVLIAAICELLHNASLIHDDIQDKDTQRRGVDSIWLKFGEDVAICLGDLMISAAYGACGELMKLSSPNPILLEKTHDSIRTTIYGQGGDLASHISKMSLFEYCELAAAKSGPLIGLPVELALATKGIKTDPNTISRAARDLGVAYQLVDDLKDWQNLRRIKKNGSRELNAVLIVSSDLLRSKGFDAVKILAKEKTNDAIINASQIPFGAGEPLIQLANNLNSLFAD